MRNTGIILIIAVSIILGIVIFIRCSGSQKSKVSEVHGDWYYITLLMRSRWLADSNQKEDYISFGLNSNCVYKGEQCYYYLYAGDYPHGARIQILITKTKSSIGYNRYHNMIEFMYLINESDNWRLIVINQNNNNSIIKTFLQK